MSVAYIRCDLCGAANPRFILDSRGLDGPLVECAQCGFRYVGEVVDPEDGRVWRWEKHDQAV